MVEKIKKLKVGKVLHDVKLSHYNTYKVGGIAKYLVYPDNEDCLIKLLKFVKEEKLNYKIIGKGSNLIFVNNFDGVLINLEHFDKLEIKNNVVTVGAGYSLIKLCLKVAKLGLTGLEFASGIPGTIGGAIFMNAGAYNSDMGYIVTKVKVLTPDLEIKTLTNKEMNFHYRTSFLQLNKNYICLEVSIVLRRGKSEAIMDVIKDRKTRRMEAQPLNYPNAGSVFRNPKDDYAGRIIEELGYKGKKEGGAMVSLKHANFIINYDKATGSDIKKLITDIQTEVLNKYNIELKIEQEIVEG